MQFETGDPATLLVRSVNWVRTPIPMSDIEIVFAGDNVPIRSKRQVLFGVTEAFGELLEYSSGDIGRTQTLVSRELLDDVQVDVTPLKNERIRVRFQWEGFQKAIEMPVLEVRQIVDDLEKHYASVYAETC